MSQSDDGTHPEIPDKAWTNPFPEQHPLSDLYERRIRNQQDLVILIDDFHSRRGTGKTVASLQLAEAMDQNGGLTKKNVTLEPGELRNMYASLPRQSAVLLDEGEIGASNREAMSVLNRALREIMSIGRVEQKYVIINTPDKSFIDKHIRQLADVWITMITKGVGLIHYFKRQPYAKGGDGALLNEKKGLIEFQDIQRNTRMREIYNFLTEQKQKHIDGKGGKEMIPESKVQERLEKARKEVRENTRHEMIRQVYERLGDLEEKDYTRMKRGGGISQSMLGEAIGLSQQQVGNIVRNE